MRFAATGVVWSQMLLVPFARAVFAPKLTFVCCASYVASLFSGFDEQWDQTVDGCRCSSIVPFSPFPQVNSFGEINFAQA